MLLEPVFHPRGLLLSDYAGFCDRYTYCRYKCSRFQSYEIFRFKPKVDYEPLDIPQQSSSRSHIIQQFYQEWGKGSLGSMKQKEYYFWLVSSTSIYIMTTYKIAIENRIDITLSTLFYFSTHSVLNKLAIISKLKD